MMAAAILLNAAAAFLGFGAAENTWGAMIAEGRQYIIESPLDRASSPGWR